MKYYLGIILLGILLIYTVYSKKEEVPVRVKLDLKNLEDDLK